MSNDKNRIEELLVENQRLRRELDLLKSTKDYNHLAKANERLEIINEIIHFAVSEMVNLDKVLEIICRAIRKIFGFHRVGIMLTNDEKNTLDGKMSLGLPKDYFNSLKLPLELKEGLGMRETVVRSAMLEKPIYILDREKDSVYKKRNEFPQKSFSKQFIVIPIKTRKRTYGILTVATSEDSSLRFTPEIIHEIKFFTEQISILVENLNLIESNEKLHFQILESLAETIEAKDSDTWGHSNRIVKFSMIIGEHLTLYPEEMKELHFASVLHDIGKIGIPDRVLLKPDKLTKKEYEIIKSHSEIGQKIISRIKGLENVGNIILHHHERWDGKGYPSRLKEKEIPILSRIITITDSFDAIISKRPYKKAMSIDFALSELKKNRGSQFDPKLVDIFLQHFKR